jgi:hypothetical protein
LDGTAGGGVAIDALPAGTPAAICRLLRRCLEKDPRHGSAVVANSPTLTAAATEAGVILGRAVDGDTRLADVAQALGGILRQTGAGSKDDRVVRKPGQSATPIPGTAGATSPFFSPDRWPQALPDGRAVLFTVGSVDSTEDYDDALVDAVRVVVYALLVRALPVDRPDQLYRLGDTTTAA